MASKKKTADSNGTIAHVSHEEFCRYWTTADTIEDVVAKTGLDKKAAQMRAYMLRKKGTQLKKFAGSRGRIDIDKLNEVIKEAS